MTSAASAEDDLAPGRYPEDGIRWGHSNLSIAGQAALAMLTPGLFFKLRSLPLVKVILA